MQLFECLQNIITTLAGTGTSGSNGDGGRASSAQLNGPSGGATDSSGNVYIADTSNNKIRMVSSAGIITTYAGTGTRGSSGDGGPATLAQLNLPSGMTVAMPWSSSFGSLYILDAGNGKIRKVSSTGIITTLRVQVEVVMVLPVRLSWVLHIQFPGGFIFRLV